jgi:RNA polymerase sigma-70 factor (ECF subfamily)
LRLASVNQEPPPQARDAADAAPDSPLALPEQQRLARAAASQIWQRHHRYLYALSLRWLHGDRAEAEDAVGDVVYKASLAVGRQHTISNERAWLTRALHNRCMDTHRRKTGIQPLDIRQDPDEDTQVEDGSGDPSAEDIFLNKELGDVIRQALAELPESLRGPVVMRLIDEEAYALISSTFRISEANARKRIQQAREILRLRLEAYVRGGEGNLPVRRAGAAVQRQKP